MKLYLHRLSLTERDFQRNIFEYSTADKGGEMPGIPSRLNWLFKVFGNEVPIVYYPKGHSGTEFRFICSQIEGNIIAGVVTKLKQAVGNFNIDNPLDQQTREQWETCDIFLNLGDDEQVLGIEENNRVASSPLKIISDLVEAVNNQNEGGYKIDVFPLHSEMSFWEAIDSHGGKVTNLKIELVVPNPEPSASTTAEEMEELKKTMNLQKKTEIFSNEEGLIIDNPATRDKEKYASRGHGAITAKSGKETIFSSEKSTTSEYVSDDYRISVAKKPSGLLARLSNILRR